MLLCAAFVATSITTSPVYAQSISPLTGRWTIEWELGRVAADDDRAIKAKGALTIVPSGDSLIATFEAQSRSDGGPLPRSFTIGGRTNGKGATFVQIQQARMNMNGEELVRQVTVTWTLRTSGDKLTGEMQREIEGLIMGAATGSPVTGSRIGS